MILWLAALAAPAAEPPAPRWPMTSWAQVDRAEFDRDGRLVKCTTATFGPVPPDTGSFCEEVPDMPPAVFDLLRGDRVGKPFAVLAETNFGVAGTPSYPPEYGRANHSLRGLASSRFTVSGDGTAHDCTLAEAKGPHQLALSACRHLRAFEAGSGERSATLLMAFSVE